VCICFVNPWKYCSQANLPSGPRVWTKDLQNVRLDCKALSALRMCRYLPPLFLNVLMGHRNSFTYFQLFIVCTASGMINLQDKYIHTAHSLVKDTYCLYVSPHWTRVLCWLRLTVEFFSSSCHLIAVILGTFIGLHTDSSCCYVACIICFEISYLCTVILSGDF
jgi:hypothetical protein